MSENLSTAVNIHFLRSSENDSARFGHVISNPEGDIVGCWTAHQCDNLEELSQHLACIEVIMTNLESQHPAIWPLAILNRIEVYEEHRGRGYGSNGLAEFTTEAAERGCKIAVLRIGWDSGSAMKKNLNFYRKNGWRELFRFKSDGEPIGEPVSYYDIGFQGKVSV